jgi:hypothetical protein
MHSFAAVNKKLVDYEQNESDTSGEVRTSGIPACSQSFEAQ